VRAGPASPPGKNYTLETSIQEKKRIRVSHRNRRNRTFPTRRRGDISLYAPESEKGEVEVWNLCPEREGLWVALRGIGRVRSGR